MNTEAILFSTGYATGYIVGNYLAKEEYIHGFGTVMRPIYVVTITLLGCAFGGVAAALLRKK